MAERYFGESIGKLGFGFMRLPEKADGSFDYEPMKKMVDRFLEAGFTYFDTAYIYPGSEEALREALVKRHPRDSFTISTKMPTYMIKKAEEMQEAFETQLERLGVDFIDFYLLHGFSLEMSKKLDPLGCWEFLRKLKAEGKIRHYGFSFHDTPENLNTILTNHPDAEFVQLQINYLDWDSKDVRARELHDAARRHNKPFVIMEPVKGGLLAGKDSAAESFLKTKNPDVSAASWAVRFAASREGLITMLSGMNTMDMLEDNIKTVKNLVPPNDTELQILRETVDIINSRPGLPCTGCRYCVEVCPKKLNIPFLLHIYNDYLVYNSKVGSGMPFLEATRGGQLPSTCIDCGQCEKRCPQHIRISDYMPKLAELFE